MTIWNPFTRESQGRVWLIVLMKSNAMKYLSKTWHILHMSSCLLSCLLFFFLPPFLLFSLFSYPICSGSVFCVFLILWSVIPNPIIASLFWHQILHKIRDWDDKNIDKIQNVLGRVMQRQKSLDSIPHEEYLNKLGKERKII